MVNAATTTATARGTEHELRALTTGVGFVVAGVLPGFLTASLAPRIRADFAFSASSLGLAVAVFYVVCTAASTPCGRLVERIGPLRGMRIGAAATAAACLAIAAFVHSAAAVIVVLSVAGLGNAMAGPAVSALLKRRFADRRHGLAFGAQQSGASLGALLAGLALPAVAIPLGWRWAFVTAAILAVAAATLAPRGHDEPGDTPPAENRRRVGRRPIGEVHVLAGAALLASAAGVAFVSFLVLYSVHRGIHEGAAGVLLGAVSLSTTLSRIGLGIATDHAQTDPLRPVAAMLLASLIGYALLIVGQPAPIVVGALLIGVLGWSWPGALTLAVVRRTPDAPAWAVGVLMAGLFGGATGGPLLVGVLAQHGSFDAAWITCGALTAAAALTVAATRRHHRSTTPRREGR
jgi:predicted MFS family arabinose efflux permease